MKVGLIFARGSNRAFGLDNKLPWHIPQDLAFFKRVTQGHAVIMGRNTWESLPKNLRPLPDRVNIVITKERLQSSYKDRLYFVRNFQDAMAAARMHQCYEAWVIGGPRVLKAAEPWAEVAAVTYVDYNDEYDVAAPRLNGKPWMLSSIHVPKVDTKHRATHSHHIQLWKPLHVLQGRQTYE